MSKAVVLMAEGFEEVEAIVPIDILRRGGVDVTLAGVGIEGDSVAGSHGVSVKIDTILSGYEQFADFDAVILPGGMPGSKNLADSWDVNELVIRMFNDMKVVGAICAAPAVVLGRLGILKNRKAVCYPGTESFAPDVDFSDEHIVRDGWLITARGAGYAADFGLELLEAIENREVSEKIGSAMLFR